MKHLLFALGAGVLLTVSASATTVTYNTLSSQLCVGASGCGVATQTIGGSVVVAFTPITTSTVEAAPTTFGSFGSVDISCVGGGSNCGSQSLAGLVLYITVNQTIPAPGGSSTIPGGTITGSVSGTASNAIINWNNGSTTNVGSIRYGVANNPLALVPVTTNNGITSVQAIITDQAIPEPSTYVLISGSLLGLGLLRRRANKQ